MFEENPLTIAGIGAAAAATERSEASTGRPSAAPESSSAEGGCLSNTHPQTSQIELEGFPEYQASGGIDWFEWSAVVKWNSSSFSRICARLETAKARCQRERVPNVWIELPKIGPIRVARTGLNRAGDRGQHFDYKICYRGIWIGLARRENGSSRLPNVYVCQTGRDCLLLGTVQTYGNVRGLLESLGAEPQAEFLSRVDLTLDVMNLDVARLQELVVRKQFITRSKRVRPHFELIADVQTGFSVGASPLYLVVYDKLKEQSAKSDRLYFEALIQRRCGGITPKHLSRIEFHVLRPRLKSVGISSPIDLFQLAGSLTKKLTTDWFRLTTEPVDRANNHQSRAATLPLWASLEKAFAAIYGQLNDPLVPLPREGIKPEKLVKQARGCLVNVLCQKAVHPETYDDFIFAVAQEFYSIAGSPRDRTEFLKEYRRRLTEYAV